VAAVRVGVQLGQGGGAALRRGVRAGRVAQRSRIRGRFGLRLLHTGIRGLAPGPSAEVVQGGRGLRRRLGEPPGDALLHRERGGRGAPSLRQFRRRPHRLGLPPIRDPRAHTHHRRGREGDGHLHGRPRQDGAGAARLRRGDARHVPRARPCGERGLDCRPRRQRPGRGPSRDWRTRTARRRRASAR